MAPRMLVEVHTLARVYLTFVTQLASKKILFMAFNPNEDKFCHVRMIFVDKLQQI